jgi:sugar phosphate isomerase/epimerase
LQVYKILNSGGLGVAGKQNELIELALTHGFNGVEVDMVDLVGRHDTLGKQFACQFLQSAKIDMGTFELPVDLGASDDDYNTAMEKLDTILDLATTLNAKGCYVSVASSSGLYSFQECFEKYQQRLQELSEKCTESSLNIGLWLRGTDCEVADGEFKFVQTAEELLTLVKAVGQPNVGVCVDAFQWAAGGGTVEHLVAAGLSDVVSEVRLADIVEGADLSALKDADRTSLPGDNLDSFSVKLCRALSEASVEVPMSISTDLGTFSTGTRDSIVGSITKQIDLLVSGEHPAEIKAAAEAAAEAAADEVEGSDAKSGESDEAAPTAPAATS